MFSDMDFLGWYSTGDSPGVQEITVHQQISDINESPLFLQANLSVIFNNYFSWSSFRWHQEPPQLIFQSLCTSL